MAPRAKRDEICSPITAADAAAVAAVAVVAAAASFFLLIKPRYSTSLQREKVTLWYGYLSLLYTAIANADSGQKVGR